LQKSAEAFRRGDWPEGRRCAEAAHSLRRDEDSRRQLAVSLLMEGDFARAWNCYRAAAAGTTL
jgi:hypothetical protein